MTFKQKLLEVLVQICWIPISAFINGCAVSLLLTAAAYAIEAFCILPGLKHVEMKEGRSYVEHTGDGYRSRYEPSDEEAMAWGYIFFALPLRCISLLLSIFALFIPRLEIRIRNDRGGFLGIMLDVA